MGASILTATRKLRGAARWKRKRKTCWRRKKRPPRKSQTKRARRKARKSLKKRNRRRSRSLRKRKVNREVRNENHQDWNAHAGGGSGLWNVRGDELRSDDCFDGLCHHTREDLHVAGRAD